MREVQDIARRVEASEAPAAVHGRLAEVFVSFQGEGTHVGERHLFVRLAGCGVGCRFCDTPDALTAGGRWQLYRPGAARAEPRANPVAPADLAALVHELAATAGAHTISLTGGEPLEQGAFVAALLAALEPLDVLLETAGMHVPAFARLPRGVAIVSMDVKLPSVAGTAPAFDVHERFLRLARDRARETYVKVVVNERVDRTEWSAAAALVARVDRSVPFVIQPETDASGRPRAPFALLDELFARARDEGLADVRVIPQVHKFLGAP